MRESRTYGSVRGARGNSRPYREGGISFRARDLIAVARCRHCEERSDKAIQPSLLVLIAANKRKCILGLRSSA